MSPPLEHDYIGLSDVPSGAGAGADAAGAEDGVLNLKETELRLGLPGCASPDRKDSVGLTLGLLPAKALVSGAKRGFADAIFGAAANGSEAEIAKGAAFKAEGQEANGAKDCAAKNAAAQDKKDRGMAPAAKAQVVGWPPIRSYRKNTMAINPSKNKEDADGKQGSGCLYIKVSMDGAPYLRKVDLKTYGSYKELSKELEKMFSGFSGQCGSNAIPSKDGLSESRLMDFLSGSEYVLTYEDKDGDWMLVGDVPWEMFTDSCRKLRIMKGSDAIGLAPRAMEKCKNWN